jgi:hypothetical protein
MNIYMNAYSEIESKTIVSLMGQYEVGEGKKMLENEKY